MCAICEDQGLCSWCGVPMDVPRDNEVVVSFGCRDHPVHHDEEEE